MHGIIRRRELQSDESTIFALAEIVVQYADGRTLTFIPEAGRESFSQDDMKEFVKTLQRASGVAEWNEVSNNANIAGY